MTSLPGFPQPFGPRQVISSHLPSWQASAVLPSTQTSFVSILHAAPALGLHPPTRTEDAARHARRSRTAGRVIGADLIRAAVPLPSFAGSGVLTVACGR